MRFVVEQMSTNVQTIMEDVITCVQTMLGAFDVDVKMDMSYLSAITEPALVTIFITYLGPNLKCHSIIKRISNVSKYFIFHSPVFFDASRLAHNPFVFSHTTLPLITWGNANSPLQISNFF